ncbi:MAG: hypothetical protein ACLQBB_02000 [Solirubrobacteraceae bacterium]
MSALDPQSLLRPGLLDGVRLAFAGPAETSSSGAGAALAAAAAELGAKVAALPLVLEEPPEQAELAAQEAFAAARSELGGCDVLVVDGAGLFAAATGPEALVDCLGACWNAARAVAGGCFLPEGRGGRILLLAPAAGAGEHAGAVAAGLENLARTLSVEWARHGVTTVAIAPGPGTDAGTLAAIVAYLASPAGAYFSGCLLDLRGPAAGAPEAAPRRSS